MPPSKFTRTGARRAGDDFQDIVALDAIVNWLENPSHYISMLVEADDSHFLDDVKLICEDGSLVLKQVKHATHPENDSDEWTWERLLEQKTGEGGKALSSLLQKWELSLRRISELHTVRDASLVSNRRPSPAFHSQLTVDNRINFAQVTDPGIRQSICAQLGGEQRAAEFFAAFRFEVATPDIEIWEAGLRRRFGTLGGTEEGWQNLKDQLRLWVRHRTLPEPDGTITLDEIRHAAKWRRLDSLPQAFEVPADYVVPSEQFHAQLVEDLISSASGCFVVTASPGFGKSTYASYLYGDLRKRGIATVRHHYFLSLKDRNLTWRLDHQRAASSLMHDLIRDCRVALGPLANSNPNPNDLGKWVDAVGDYYSSRGTPLIVIVDGLDHVWREQQSVYQLEHLLGHLLPAPSGVIVVLVTQPVSDEKIPPCVLRDAPRNGWIELPALRRSAVHRWLRYHSSEIVQLGRASNHLIAGLTGAFYTKTGGHPLHLRYTLNALLERGVQVNSETVYALPPCPHQDIIQYYDALWQSLPEESRELLHLLAACPFVWPRNGLIETLDPQARDIPKIHRHLQLVSHMLVQDALGWRPFHSSLIAYTQAREDHEWYASAMKQKALEWLRERAPELWRFAYTWSVEADLGNDGPLRDGPGRDWAVNAIANRYPLKEILAILSRSAWHNVQSGNLPRAIELGLLRSYVKDAYEWTEDKVGALLGTQIVTSDNKFLVPYLRSEISALHPDELVALAEAEHKQGNAKAVDACYKEARQRVNDPGPRDPTGMRNRLSDALCASRIAALLGPAETARVMTFVNSTKGAQLAHPILTTYAEQLFRTRQTEAMRVLLSSANRLLPSERPSIYRAAVLLALEQGMDISDVVDQNPEADPFLVTFAILRNTGTSFSVPTAFPESSLLAVGKSDIDNGFEAAAYSAFWAFVANDLRGKPEENEKWLTLVDDYTLPRKAMHELRLAAGDIAERLRQKKPVDHEALYRCIARLNLPENDGETSPVLVTFAFAITKAVRRISVELLLISGSLGGDRLTVQEVATAFRSPYFIPRDWIRLVVTTGRALLTPDATMWVLDELSKQMANSVEEFTERAEQFALMAAFAVQHGLLERAAELVRNAVSNRVAYGNHKDMLLFQVIDSVRACHRAGIPGGRGWLLSLAPAVAGVTQYTNGDETGHLSEVLADALAEVAPDLLIAYYRWLSENEEFYDALHAFNAFIQTADLSIPVNQAIALTAIDDSSQAILMNRVDNGDEGARKAVASISELLGEYHPTVERDRHTETPIPGTDTAALPSPEDYLPERFTDYVDALIAAGIYWREEHLATWIKHWRDRGKAAELLCAFSAAEERGIDIRSYDTAFDLALQIYGKDTAYPWLVRAHIEEYGWRTYYTSKEKAVRRWEVVNTHYPERWLQFIHDTFRARFGPAWSQFTVSNLDILRLVEYCIHTGHTETAQQVTEQAVVSTLELVSPVNIPTPLWTKQ